MQTNLAYLIKHFLTFAKGEEKGGGRGVRGGGGEERRGRGREREC